MRILITGTPGSGKTTLVSFAHSQRDERFFDADEVVGLCEWRDFKTGEVMGLVTEFIEDGTDEWYEKYGWYWRPDFLKKFLESHADVVLCGSAENVIELHGLFNSVVVLVKSESDLIRNLENPARNNPFGKTTVQREDFMEWQEYLLKNVNSSKPLCIYGNDTVKAYKEVIHNYFS